MYVTWYILSFHEDLDDNLNAHSNAIFQFIEQLNEISNYQHSERVYD